MGGPGKKRLPGQRLLRPTQTDSPVLALEVGQVREEQPVPLPSLCFTSKRAGQKAAWSEPPPRDGGGMQVLLERLVRRRSVRTDATDFPEDTGILQ